MEVPSCAGGVARVVLGSQTCLLPAWSCKLTFTGHTHFVGPVVELPDGTIATGGYDGMIIVWSTGESRLHGCVWCQRGAFAHSRVAGAAEAQLTLLGHEQAVVALAVTAGGDVISGSWDKTVRVWHKGEVAQILRGHQEAVWGVAGAPNGTHSVTRTPVAVLL